MKQIGAFASRIELPVNGATTFTLRPVYSGGFRMAPFGTQYATSRVYRGSFRHQRTVVRLAQRLLQRAPSLQGRGKPIQKP